VPISSTKTRGAGLERLGERHPPGRCLPFVSFHRPHSPFFRLNPIRLRSLLKVGSLMLLPAKLLRKRRLSSTVADGLWCLRPPPVASWWRRPLRGYGGSAASLPGGKRLASVGEFGVALETEERLMEKRRAASDLEVPRWFTASTTFFLRRSSE
jgi:hypothetical protein